MLLNQKHFVRYLSEKTNNQYFIATHSAHILATPDAEVFHVRLVDGQSIVETASTDSAKSRICDDLGYRASDLLQANCVIWVEGPSDRTYINHWIQAVDENLTEGLHYSIMFYGGRLLSHLTANDPEVDDFISLRRLNRHIAILIDSDLSDKSNEINDTKKRVQKEFDNDPGFAWITQGREIENYVHPEILEKAVRAIYGDEAHIKKGQYDNCLKYNAPDKKIKNRDKVKVAREVAKLPADLKVLDLEAQIRKLVKFVHSCNESV